MRDTAIQLWADEWDEYELLDSGGGKKFERFGVHTVVRDEPKAWWPARLPVACWGRADAIHTTLSGERGRWQWRCAAPREWPLRFESLSFLARTAGGSKHVGVFPEQSAEWRFVRDRIAASNRRRARVLNLFGYTGALTLVAAQAGAEVTHVDASKVAIGWARDNQRASGLEEAPIRWILDDALKFAARERRRGVRYDVIVLDPPAFGRGPQGQVWKVEEQLLPLLRDCAMLLNDDPLFVFLTAYRTGESALVLDNVLRSALSGRGGRHAVGEFALRPKGDGFVLPMSGFALWEAGE